MNCRFPAILVSIAAILTALARPASLNPAQLADLGIKRIAFTFDDGPRPEGTQDLIDLLDVKNVRGTFFVVGQQAEKYPDLVRELASRGHEVDNHSWSHPLIETVSAKAFQLELDKTRFLIKKLTGRETFLFRAPGGTEDYLRHDLVVPWGYRMVLWTVHTLDHEKPPPEQIRERVLDGARDGAIVLFHTGVKSTLEALPDLIDTLKEQGYSFVTVSELLGQDSARLAFISPTHL